MVACLVLLSAGALLAEAGSGITARPLSIATVNSLPMPLDAAAKQGLLANGSYSAFSKGQPKVDLCPDVASRTDIASILGASPSNIGIQTLVVAAMPAGLRARPDRTLQFYNLLHRFRTMEGIPYFSSTHHQLRILFTASHVVKSLENLTPLDDPRYAATKPAHELLLEQDDTTFGKNLYAVTVKGHRSGAVELSMINVERVWFGLVPVMKPRALRLTMVVKASADGEYLYFYGNVGINATKLFGMEEQVRISFYNRMIALYHWYALGAASQ